MANLSAIAPVNLLTSASAINPVFISTPTVGTGFGFDNSSAIVELSGVGQLLSAVSSAEANLAALAPGSSTGGIGQNFGTDFGSLAAEAQFFVDSFNGVQNAINGLIGPAGPLNGEPLATDIVAAFNSQATATFDNGTGPTTLAQIGINFNASPIPGNGGTLSIDLNALQSAFQANPTGTFDLLSQAAHASGDLAGSAVGQANDLLSTVGAQAQANAIQQSLVTNLLLQGSLLGGTGLLGTGSTGIGLATLLALSSPLGLGNGNGSSSLLQDFLALNQFAMVSSLLG